MAVVNKIVPIVQIVYRCINCFAEPCAGARRSSSNAKSAKAREGCKVLGMNPSDGVSYWNTISVTLYRALTKFIGTLTQGCVAALLTRGCIRLPLRGSGQWPAVTTCIIL